MKFKYIGDLDEITIRTVTFRRNETVNVSDGDLADKISVLDFFTEVKAGRPKNADKE